MLYHARMIDIEIATAVAKYLNRVADTLTGYIENDEPEKAVFAIFTLDESVSPDKEVGALFIQSIMTRADLLDLAAPATPLPHAPEISEAKEELAKALAKWEEYN